MHTLVHTALFCTPKVHELGQLGDDQALSAVWPEGVPHEGVGSDVWVN